MGQKAFWVFGRRALCPHFWTLACLQDCKPLAEQFHDLCRREIGFGQGCGRAGGLKLRQLPIKGISRTPDIGRRFVADIPSGQDFVRETPVEHVLEIPERRKPSHPFMSVTADGKRTDSRA